MDRVYVHLKKTRGGGVGEPEFRLREFQACYLVNLDPDIYIFCLDSFYGTRDDCAPYWSFIGRMGSSETCIVGCNRCREH